MMIDSLKAASGAGGKVGVGLDDDVSDGMLCSDHPYRNNPGGICAFCLQEKLGKLVSSSLPLPIRASSSSPSSPTSEALNTASNGGNATVSSSSSSNATSKTVSFNGADCHFQTRRARISFLLAKKKKKVLSENDIVFKRSKSTTTPRKPQYSDDFTPRKRGGFWSFLYPTSTKSHAPAKKPENVIRTHNTIIEEEEESPNSQTTGSGTSSFERKVSRSRSVGCGSRSFSGDFFERISTGFGDCTLRRVESQRERKPVAGDCIKERVKCGGIFSGFMMTSSSSSSSSSSYWVSSSTEELAGKPTVINGRSKNWGWAFASPMRAFSSKDKKRSIIRQASENNPSPDLNAIPSLLAVRS